MELLARPARPELPYTENSHPEEESQGVQFPLVCDQGGTIPFIRA